jgi:L-rhamnose-H+ transport protein
LSNLGFNLTKELYFLTNLLLGLHISLGHLAVIYIYSYIYAGLTKITLNFLFMNITLLAGVLLIILGGFANGSFYIPFKRVRNWAWEVFWLVGGVFSWIIAPWVVSFLTVPNLLELFNEAPVIDLMWPFLFGILWGVGSLTFGLSMRYLGVALGLTIALGLTAAFGALIPPVFKGEFGAMIATVSGKVTVIGVLVCLMGIAITGIAGMRKDKEVSLEKKKESIKDFNFKKGLIVAFFAGLMSAAFAFGVSAGKPLAELAIAKGTATLYSNNPTFILVMFGGFITNAIWCIYLQFKNKTSRDFVKTKDTPIVSNYLFSALAGVLWYLQMMFYGMGETIMGEVAGWIILMSSSILFSNMWGLITHEWQGVKTRTYYVLASGLLVLILSTLIFGYGKSLSLKETQPAVASLVQECNQSETNREAKCCAADSQDKKCCEKLCDKPCEKLCA